VATSIFDSVLCVGDTAKPVLPGCPAGNLAVKFQSSLAGSPRPNLRNVVPSNLGWILRRSVRGCPAQTWLQAEACGPHLHRPASPPLGPETPGPIPAFPQRSGCADRPHFRARCRSQDVRTPRQHFGTAKKGFCSATNKRRLGCGY